MVTVFAMHMAVRTSVTARVKRKALPASVRAKVEYPFRVIKREFGLAEGKVQRTGQEHRTRG